LRSTTTLAGVQVTAAHPAASAPAPTATQNEWRVIVGDFPIHRTLDFGSI
jgi:hypothetical protein